MINRLTLSFLIGLTVYFLIPSLTSATSTIPLSPHCIEGGPLPLNEPDYCGCTWGKVYFRGQPVVGAKVTLSFNGQMIEDISSVRSGDSEPYFILRGETLGAKLHDTMTLTVEFAGQTVTRSFRAAPEDGGEQEVSIVLEERGQWTRVFPSDFAESVAINEEVAWAGGTEGLVSLDLSSGISNTYTLPWPNETVKDIAVAPNDHVWIVTESNVGQFDGNQWIPHTVELFGIDHSIATTPTSGDIWVGGGDGSGGYIRRYSESANTWSMMEEPFDRVTDLAANESGSVWASTWGDGLYELDNSGTIQQFTRDEGLPADFLYSVVADNEFAWVGSDQGQEIGSELIGGLGRYDIANDSWRNFTTTNGLPASELSDNVPGAIFSLAIDDDGVPWAGTTQGGYVQTTNNQWTKHLATNSGDVTALTGDGAYQLAIDSEGVWFWDSNEPVGTVPEAEMNNPSGQIFTPDEDIVLEASAVDLDETGDQIRAWEWSSDRDGPICTTAGECRLDAQVLSSGIHIISLRVQDDEGAWSMPVTQELIIQPQTAETVYLPFLSQ